MYKWNIYTMNIELEVINCLNDILTKVEKKEKRRLKIKEYKEKNKEKIKLKQKEYREKNKDKILSQNREYKEKNKEKIKLKKKQYRQTPEAIKKNRISNWKHYGIIVEDWDGLYYRYLSTAWCDACKVKLTYDKKTTSTTKVVDHCHITGEFRNILCNACNIKRK